jgi:hypothetical protein
MHNSSTASPHQRTSLPHHNHYGHVSACSAPGPYFNHHKIQTATISWAGISGNDHNKHWGFKLDGEDSQLRLDPIRVFPAVDSTPEWIQPRRADYGLSARCYDDGDLVNRSQKRVQESM